MTYRWRVLTVLLLVLVPAPADSYGHGASIGLHLHVTPEPVLAGQQLNISLTAAEPVRLVRLSFVGQQPVSWVVDPPTRFVTRSVTVPASAREQRVINLQATATSVADTRFKTSAVVRLVGTRASYLCAWR